MAINIKVKVPKGTKWKVNAKLGWKKSKKIKVNTRNLAKTKPKPKKT